MRTGIKVGERNIPDKYLAIIKLRNSKESLQIPQITGIPFVNSCLPNQLNEKQCQRKTAD